MTKRQQRIIGVLLALVATAALVLTVALSVNAGGYDHDEKPECPDGYLTQGYDHKDKDKDKDKDCDTTTTTSTTTSTTVMVTVEVCRDGQIITIPVDELLESDDRIWDDFDRRDCQPSRQASTTTIPEVIIPGPIYSVGYICPGTDGIVYELPWGTYEDMWPTPESAKAYGCPVVEDPTNTTVVLTELPFTGVGDSLIWLACGLLVIGGLLVVTMREETSDGME